MKYLTFQHNLINQLVFNQISIKMANLKLFIFLILKFNLSFQAKYRKVSSLKSYNTLSLTKAPKSAMQCCSICSITMGCEGIKFEGDFCSFLSNPVEDDTNDATDSTNIWINTEIKSKCKTRHQDVFKNQGYLLVSEQSFKQTKLCLIN